MVLQQPQHVMQGRSKRTTHHTLSDIIQIYNSLLISYLRPREGQAFSKHGPNNCGISICSLSAMPALNIYVASTRYALLTVIII